jgi:8-oxo-dGTP pyrophosphatase MutT (NUDIX family)
MRSVRKVLAYIVADSQLLVFVHPQHPEVGVQVPAGTVEPNETLEIAVLREAHEETGLSGFGVPAYLGAATFEMSPYGRAELHERHFFRLAYARAVPSTWRHVETHAGSATHEVFEFSWSPLASVPELAVGHGAFLHALRQAD